MTLANTISVFQDMLESPDFGFTGEERDALTDAIRRLRGAQVPARSRMTPEEIKWSKAVKARDGWRCRAPGCNRANVEAAHIFRRWHGATKWDPDNGISLCTVHHKDFDEGDQEQAEALAILCVGKERYEELRQQSQVTLKRVARPV